MTSWSVSPSIIELTRRRWLLPALTALHRGTPARLSALVTALGASRGGVVEAIVAMIDLGLLVRTLPPRHPLQPEFVLTLPGSCLAAVADALARVADALAVAPLLRTRWALPVIASLEEPMRYGALRRALPAVTDRALALALAGLVEAQLVRRDVFPVLRPPATCYSLLPHSYPLATILHHSPLGQSPASG